MDPSPANGLPLGSTAGLLNFVRFGTAVFLGVVCDTAEAAIKVSDSSRILAAVAVAATSDRCEILRKPFEFICLTLFQDRAARLHSRRYDGDYLREHPRWSNDLFTDQE